MPKLISFLTGFIFLVLLQSCGDSVGREGKVVGGACTENKDCASDSKCLDNTDDFPGGTCALSCNEQEDCPEGARCVEKEDGVCLLHCDFPKDCRGGYTCKGVKNVGEGGESSVCIGD